MCIALVAEAGKRPTKKALFSGWTANRDGGGFAYVNDGEVKIEKGFMVYNEFEKALEAALDTNEDSPFLIHMRIGTSGGKTKQNTHPFRLAKSGGAMIHNGVLFEPTGQWEGPVDDRKSDTRAFCEALGQILDYESVLRGKQMLANAIGGYNKLAFLYPDKSTVIVNETSGFWVDGIWYSNGSCQVRPAVVAR